MESQRQEPEKVKKFRMPKTKKLVSATALLVSVALGTGAYTKSKQDEVNSEHSGLNSVFSVSELSTQKLIKETICTSMYSSRAAQLLNAKLDKYGIIDGGLDMFKDIPDTGSIFLSPDEVSGKSLSEIRKTISHIRTEKSDILVAMDFEGGFVKTFKITEAELKKYAFPKRIIDLRKAEYDSLSTRSKKNLGAFPSQEFIGKSYNELKDENQKKAFLKDITLYSKALANLFEDIGVNMMFGPVVDIVRDTEDRKNLLSKHDRAYSGTNVPVASKIVSELTLAYIKGFEGRNVIAVPKHFAGVGLTKEDPHDKHSNVEDLQKSATLLTWRNVIRGCLDNIDMKIGKIDKDESAISSEIMGNLVKISESDSQAMALDNANLKLTNEKIRATKERNKEKKHAKKPKGKKGKNPMKTPQKQAYSIRISAINKEISKNNEELSKVKQAVASLRRENANLNSIIHEMRLSKKILESDKEKLSPPIALMTGNVYFDGYGDPNTPIMFSRASIDVLTRYDKTFQNGLGFKGIIVTDDAKMESSYNYIKERYAGEDADEMSVVEGLRAGNTVVLIKNISDKVDSITGDIPRYFNGTDANRLAFRYIMEDNAKKILNLKVKLGLLDTINIRGVEYYKVKMPRNITRSKVLRDSFFSNQWPWLIKKSYHELENPEIVRESSIRMLYAASKNFALSFWRTMDHIIKSDPHLRENEKREKVIVVDKSVRQIFIYDKKTGKTLKTFEIGIGKGTAELGGISDRRIFGDHKTPAGFFQLVQKRDSKYWEEKKGGKMPEEYGGEAGGMLVLAGPWHPNIAIHGTTGKPTGEVSNGCVRTDNGKINELMETIPLGTMVLITN